MGGAELRMVAAEGIGEIAQGHDLAQEVLDAAKRSNWFFQDGDVVVIAQKIVSKAEGRVLRPETVTPSPQAQALATATYKDPHIVELILGESDEVVRQKPGVIVVAHKRGWVMANAGIDQSNLQDSDHTVLLLPVDPDNSARIIHDGITAATGAQTGVIIADSFGRAWRKGTTGVALGSAGIEALEDWRGLSDRYGRTLAHTEIARADELATAAGLLMGQADEGRPVVFVRGAPVRLSTTATAADLVRPKAEDMFR